VTQTIFRPNPLRCLAENDGFSRLFLGAFEVRNLIVQFVLTANQPISDITPRNPFVDELQHLSPSTTLVQTCIALLKRCQQLFCIWVICHRDLLALSYQAQRRHDKEIRGAQTAAEDRLRDMTDSLRQQVNYLAISLEVADWSIRCMRRACVCCCLDLSVEGR
jgi:hypothetical protein